LICQVATDDRKANEPQRTMKRYLANDIFLFSNHTLPKTAFPVNARNSAHLQEIIRDIARILIEKGRQKMLLSLTINGGST